MGGIGTLENAQGLPQSRTGKGTVLGGVSNEQLFGHSQGLDIGCETRIASHLPHARLSPVRKAAA
jgi:hypothetical protein